MKVVQTSARLGGPVRPDPVPQDPRDVIGDGKRLAVVATRVRHDPSTPLEARMVELARLLRGYASRSFGELGGVRRDDRSRIFGELLAYRASISALAIGLRLGEARSALRAIEAELNEALRWAIEAGPVAK